MRLEVQVRVDGPDRPRAGSLIKVEVQDAPFADAPATVIAEASGTVRDEPGDRIGSVELALGDVPKDALLRVHVDVDADGKVSKGDFVSTQSHPVPSVSPAVCPVTVRRI